MRQNLVDQPAQAADGKTQLQGATEPPLVVSMVGIVQSFGVKVPPGEATARGTNQLTVGGEIRMVAREQWIKQPGRQVKRTQQHGLLVLVRKQTVLRTIPVGERALVHAESLATAGLERQEMKAVPM